MLNYHLSNSKKAHFVPYAVTRWRLYISMVPSMFCQALSLETLKLLPLFEQVSVCVFPAHSSLKACFQDQANKLHALYRRRDKPDWRVKYQQSQQLNAHQA